MSSSKATRSRIKFLMTFTILLIGVLPSASLASHFLNADLLPLPHTVNAASGNNVLGIACGFGASDPTLPFPTPITTPDGTGQLSSTCQWAGDVDGDARATPDPLVSDLPEASGTIPNPGGGFTADILITNLNTTVNGFDITLYYDTRVLNAVVFDQSGLQFGGTQSITLAQYINPVNGTVHLAQALLGVFLGCLNPPCTNVSVVLFRVRFDVVGAGVGSISFATNPLCNQNTNHCNEINNPQPVKHTTQSGSLATSAWFNLLNNRPSGLGFLVNWTFSPNPEVPGAPLTFNAMASCQNCTGPLSYRWDFSSLDLSTYSQKVDRAGSTVTVTAPPPVINRVTLMVNDSAVPSHGVTAVRRLPLTVSISGAGTLLQGTAGGSWTGRWLGGVVTSTSGYSGQWSFCPGSRTVKTVCSAPPTPFTQNLGSINQTVSLSNVKYNFTGVYNNLLRISDTTVSQVSANPTTISVGSVNVTGTTAAYTVSLTTSASSIFRNSLMTFGAAVSYATATSTNPAYPTAFRSQVFSYLFNFGDGTNTTVTGGAVITSVTHNYTATGSFVVRVMVQELGSSSTSKIQENGFSPSFTVTPPFTADFSFTPSSPNTGQPMSFTSTASGGAAPYTYSWDFGDGGTATGNSSTHTYSSGGNFTVKLTVTDSVGNTVVAIHAVVVTAQSAPQSFLVYIAGGAVAAAAVAGVGLLLFLRRRKAHRSPSPVNPSSN